MHEHINFHKLTHECEHVYTIRLHNYTLNIHLSSTCTNTHRNMPINIYTQTQIYIHKDIQIKTNIKIKY